PPGRRGRSLWAESGTGPCERGPASWTRASWALRAGPVRAGLGRACSDELQGPGGVLGELGQQGLVVGEAAVERGDHVLERGLPVAVLTREAGLEQVGHDRHRGRGTRGGPEQS